MPWSREQDDVEFKVLQVTETEVEGSSYRVKRRKRRRFVPHPTGRAVYAMKYSFSVAERERGSLIVESSISFAWVCGGGSIYDNTQWTNEPACARISKKE